MKHAVAAHVARWTARLLATAALALIFLRLLHTTAPGIALVDAIPDGFWNVVHDFIGWGRGGGAETLQDADAAILLTGCLIVAATLIGLLEALLFKRSTTDADS